MPGRARSRQYHCRARNRTGPPHKPRLSRGRATRKAARRARIHRRAVMRVRAAHAVEEFIANCLAGDGRSGVEDLLHRRTIARGRRMSCEPFRVAAAGAFARDVVHVFDHRAQPGERTGCGTFDRCSDVVRDEATAIGFRRHLRCVPYLRAARYQSRIFAPSQATTPSCASSSAKVRSTCPMRCGTPER